MIKKYIQESSKRKKQYMLFKHIPIIIVNELPQNIDIQISLDMIEENIPFHFISEIEGFYIGDFKELEARKIKAMFKDGIVYVSSYKNDKFINEILIAQDIIHEIAHSTEVKYDYDLYFDKTIEKEFLSKRNKLFNILKSQNLLNNLSLEDFLETEYQLSFDKFLYNDIGYDKLSLLTVGLFLNPYAITSLSEYFASAFEEYYSGDRDYLKDISKILYNKIEMLGEENAYT